MREEIRKLFPLEFYINDKEEMVAEISLNTLDKLSDEIIKLQEELEKNKKLDEYLKIMIDRNNKAIEYIKSIEYEDGFTNKMVYYDEDETCIELLNILQGSDEE